MKRALAALTGLWLLSACGLFGPKGPGTLTARVDATGVGLSGAVLQVSGTGIRGFSSAGGSRVFSRAEGNAWRVVVVNPDAAGLDFKVEVEDVATASPSAIVFDASDISNQTVDPGANVHVTFGQ